MAASWPTVRVEEIAGVSAHAMATGPFGSAISSKHFVPDGVPVLRGSNLSDRIEHRLKDDGLAFLEVEKAATFKRSIASRGDLVFTCWGTIGQVGIVDERSRYSEYIVSNKQMKLTPDPSKADSLFLYYLFSSDEVRDRIVGQAIGSSVPGFNLGQLRALEIPLPPLDEQRRIAHILGTLDDKIELNRRMNETLEEMARALFKSWFVDFDPVRAKAEGRDPGLPKHLADLFPDRLVDSELGKIPEGWQVGAIGAIADVVDCLHSKKPERRESGRPMLQLSNIRDDGLLDLTDLFAIADDDYAKWTSRLEAKEGDCVITNVGRVGAVAQVPAGLKAALGRNMTGVRAKGAFPFPTFLLESLLSEAMRGEIVRRTDAGTILNALNVKSVPLLRFAQPPAFLASEFERAARPIRARMEESLRESATIVDARDVLLASLFGTVHTARQGTGEVTGSTP